MNQKNNTAKTPIEKLITEDSESEENPQSPLDSLFEEIENQAKKEMIEEGLPFGDHRDAMMWILQINSTTGMVFINREIRGHLNALAEEYLRLCRMEDRYKKLLQDTAEYRKQRRQEQKIRSKK